jgi:hypothetical protein
MAIGDGEVPTDIELDNTSIIENSAGSVIGTLTVTDSDVDSYSLHDSTLPSPVVTTPAATAVVGAEFQVNTYTDSIQKDSDITTLSDGSYIVVWKSWGQGSGVFGQRYDSSGATIGAEFQISSTTHNSPVITALSDGGFVVAWQNSTQISGQRYDGSGATVGSESVFATVVDNISSITALNNGGFFIVWERGGSGVLGQQFDNTNAKIGPAFIINTLTGGDQKQPSVATLTNGDFVVTWQDSGTRCVQAQLFDSSGNALGDEFQVNTYTHSVSISVEKFPPVSVQKFPLCLGYLHCF